MYESDALVLWCDGGSWRACVRGEGTGGGGGVGGVDDEGCVCLPPFCVVSKEEGNVGTCRGATRMNRRLQGATNRSVVGWSHFRTLQEAEAGHGCSGGRTPHRVDHGWQEAPGEGQD